MLQTSSEMSGWLNSGQERKISEKMLRFFADESCDFTIVSTLEIIFCALPAENYFVKVLIPFIGVREIYCFGAGKGSNSEYCKGMKMNPPYLLNSFFTRNSEPWSPLYFLTG
jgi:hypothetical protein